MGRVLVRRATREDIENFSDATMKPTMKAWLGELDGKILGMGGLALSNGRWFAFCDLTDEARKYKMTIVKISYEIMRDAKRSGIKFVYADADTEEPMSRRWLASLGFIPDLKTGLYRCRV